MRAYYTVIPSRHMRFWWEWVLVCDGEIVRSLGQDRSAQAAWDLVRLHICCTSPINTNRT